MPYRYLFLPLLMTALVACGNRNADNAGLQVPDCLERSTPFTTSGGPRSDGTQSGAFSFSGFRLGDDPARVESTVSEKKPGYSATRAECGNASLQIRLGNNPRDDGSPVCDMAGPKSCELYSIGLSKLKDGAPSLSSLFYVARFPEGRPTDSVISDIEQLQGKAFWRFSAPNSAGWPGLKRETSLLWTNRTDVSPARFANESLVNSVYGTLGPGQYFTARLIHGTEDTSVTYAMQVEMFVRSK